MLYHLYKWFEAENLHFPGVGLFQFITFRVLMAVILSLFITTIFGKKLINYLKKKQIGETVVLPFVPVTPTSLSLRVGAS